MALKKISLAYDGSDDSKKASTWVLDFAKQTSVENHSQVPVLVIK